MLKNISIKNKDKKCHLNIKKKYNTKQFRYTLKIIFTILIILLSLFSLTKRKKKQKKIKFKYFACFGAIARLENLYIRDLISYYLSIGFSKFIFGDNNYPNIEKISDVTQDYIKKGIVDIIEIFGSSINQDAFYEIIYQKYKRKCNWISFFDIDEYLRMHSQDNEIISVQQYLSNPIFQKCESITINWLIYSDNNILNYDNRSVLERFTTPCYTNRENRLVKSIVRGNLNKKVFTSSSHVPDKRIMRCNSIGKRIKYYSYFYLKPPVLKYTYLMHYTTKTIEEYINKTIKRGQNGNLIYDKNERVRKFFQINNFTKEKLRIFEKAFNMTFDQYYNYTNSDDKTNLKMIIIIIISLSSLFL